MTKNSIVVSYDEESASHCYVVRVRRPVQGRFSLAVLRVDIDSILHQERHDFVLVALRSPVERRVVPLVEGIDASPFGYVVANHSKPSFICRLKDGIGGSKHTIGKTPRTADTL